MRSVPDGFLIQVLINIFYSIYIFINSVAIFLLDALVLCRSADLLILLFF